ncbi:hypothetical protein [Sphingobacterium kyonggiense]
MDSSTFRIHQIKLDKSVYIIYAKRNDSTFKIISEREVDISTCVKIKVHQSYRLNLKKIIPADSMGGRRMIPNDIVTSFGYKESVIKVEKKSHNALYFAENLNGLCYVRVEDL